MIELGKTMHGLQVGRLIPSYTGVIIKAGASDNGSSAEYSAGDDSGYVLTIENPWGTQEQADAILAALKLRGAKYQPFTAASAPVDPAIEIGDAVSVNGTEAVAWNITTQHTRMMAADLAAPFDEEVARDFNYQPKTVREFKREQKYTRSRLTLNEEAITAEVVRATAEEAELAGRLTIAADAINAKVSKSGGDASSFAWTLFSDRWKLTANSTDVFVADAQGVTIEGNITATTGFIGTRANGFSISANNIHKGMTSLSDTTNNGVYIGSDGIALGKGAFKVTASGAVTCASITITGGDVYASTIKYGATGGYLSGDGIATGTISGGSGGKLRSGTVSTYNTESGINTSLGYANLFGSATQINTSVYPNTFEADTIVARQINIQSNGNGNPMLIFSGGVFSPKYFSSLGGWVLWAGGEG